MLQVCIKCFSKQTNLDNHRGRAGSGSWYGNACVISPIHTECPDEFLPNFVPRAISVFRMATVDGDYLEKEMALGRGIQNSSALSESR